MTAPDHTLEPFKNHLHQRGHPYMHKASEGRGPPFPGRICTTLSVTGMPSVVSPFMMAMRTWICATRRTVMRRCPSSFIQCILVSAVVSATISRDRLAQVFRRSQRLVSGQRISGGRRPGLGVSVGQNNGVAASIPRWHPSIGACRVRHRQHRRLSDVVSSNFNGPGLWCLCDDPAIGRLRRNRLSGSGGGSCAIRASSGCRACRSRSLALDAGADHQQVQRLGMLGGQLLQPFAVRPGRQMHLRVPGSSDHRFR